MAISQAPKDFLRSLFDAAVAAAQPAVCLPPHLPEPPPPSSNGRTLVIGAGKASAAMAKAAVEKAWEGPLEGLVVTRYGHGVPCERIEIVEAAHPVPDAAGRAAAARMLETGPGPWRRKIWLLCLISGGGSALLVPAGGGDHASKTSRRSTRRC